MKIKSPFRAAKRKLKKKYTVTLFEDRKGRLCLPIPDEICEVFGIEVGDVAIFEVVNKKTFVVRFVNKNMISFVEKI